MLRFTKVKASCPLLFIPVIFLFFFFWPYYVLLGPVLEAERSGLHTTLSFSGLSEGGADTHSRVRAGAGGPQAHGAKHSGDRGERAGPQKQVSGMNTAPQAHDTGKAPGEGTPQEPRHGGGESQHLGRRGVNRGRPGRDGGVTRGGVWTVGQRPGLPPGPRGEPVRRVEGGGARRAQRTGSFVRTPNGKCELERGYFERLGRHQSPTCQLPAPRSRARLSNAPRISSDGLPGSVAHRARSERCEILLLKRNQRNKPVH